MKTKIPNSAWFHITSECNLNCFYCALSCGRALYNELKTEEIFDIIKDLSDSGISRLYITGGEPLLRKDFFEIVDYGTKIGLEVVIETNGFILTREKLNKIKNLKVNRINLSLDGVKAETHDYIRGVKGSFERVINSIEISKELKFQVSVYYCVNKYNINESLAFIDLMVRLGVPKIGFLKFSLAGRGRNYQNLWINPEEWVRFYKKIEKKRQDLKDIIEIRYTPSLVRVSEADTTGKLIPFCGARERASCSCNISPIGDLYPCPLLPNFPLGNLRKNKFLDIWTKSKNWEYWNNPDLKKLCPNCKYKDKCMGGCRAYAYILGGDIRGKDPRCRGNLLPYCPSSLMIHSRRK